MRVAILFLLNNDFQSDFASCGRSALLQEKRTTVIDK